MSTEYVHKTAESQEGTALGASFSLGQGEGFGFQWAVGGTLLVAMLSSGWVESEDGHMLQVSEFLKRVSNLHEVFKYCDKDVV